MMGELGGRAPAWKRTPERDVRPRHDHSMLRPAGTPVSPGRLVGTGKVSFALKGAGSMACEITKPCRLWDGGSVSGGMKSRAAWLAP